MTDPAIDEALDELYGADPSEFVALRKRSAASLRSAGDKDGAVELVECLVDRGVGHAGRALAAAFGEGDDRVELGVGEGDDREAVTFREQPAVGELRNRAELVE